MIVCGHGLHGGAPCEVTLTRREGPLVVEVAGQSAPLVGARVISALRSTTIAVGDATLATVEHLASALFALGISRDLHVRASAPELPLLDGAASAWIAALIECGFPLESARAPFGARVVRAAERAFDGALFAFAPASESVITARVVLEDARFDRAVEWRGDATDYAKRIAPARTFARESDVMELAERGLAAHVPPESVVVLCKNSVLSRGAPFADDEPARHKLLDLIGDVFVRVGLLAGHVRATRPGHALNHAALTWALAEGVIALTDTRC